MLKGSVNFWPGWSLSPFLGLSVCLLSSRVSRAALRIRILLLPPAFLTCCFSDCLFCLCVLFFFLHFVRLGLYIKFFTLCLCTSAFSNCVFCLEHCLCFQWISKHGLSFLRCLFVLEHKVNYAVLVDACTQWLCVAWSAVSKHVCI